MYTRLALASARPYTSQPDVANGQIGGLMTHQHGVVRGDVLK